MQQCVDGLIEYFENEEGLDDDDTNEDGGEKQNKAQMSLKNR